MTNAQAAASAPNTSPRTALSARFTLGSVAGSRRQALAINRPRPRSSAHGRYLRPLAALRSGPRQGVMGERQERDAGSVAAKRAAAHPDRLETVPDQQGPFVIVPPALGTDGEQNTFPVRKRPAEPRGRARVGHEAQPPAAQAVQVI